MRSEEMAHTEGTGFRPSRWAWTTYTAWVLLALLLFAVAVLANDYADSLGSSAAPRLDATVLAALQRGLAIALIPMIVVVSIARRISRKGKDVDEGAGAAFGVLAVVVLVLGLAGASSHLPEGQGARLSLETALSVLGATLLGVSVWMRHVPRPWWPRGEVSG
jgi:hypothetical protein